ncbi:MAG: hypothetical protein U0939_21635 [Pirellulales bacterium]
MNAGDQSATQPATSVTASSAESPVAGDLPLGVSGTGATQRMPVEGAPLRWLMSAILAWGVVLAGGVVWYDYVAGRIIWWKPLIIVVCSLAFLALWRLAIMRRAAL